MVVSLAVIATVTYFSAGTLGPAMAGAIISGAVAGGMGSLASLRLSAMDLT
jgi:hypothetical protein